MGYEVKTIGDAFLVAFRSADKALDYALALHDQSGDPEPITPTTRAAKLAAGPC